MELALSLGDTPKPFSFLDKSQKIIGTDLGCCMAVGKVSADGVKNTKTGLSLDQRGTSSSDPPVQLDLLPFSPVHRSTHQPSSNKIPFPWLTHNLVAEPAETSGLVVNPAVEEVEEGAAISSPNSISVSQFQMDFSKIKGKILADFEGEDRGLSTPSRGSDEEENALARKKLRLSKEQSAFLEESFKEHNTLNPKQKLALAKQLSLRPRQVEVWFQNRRARTKLKQTEVDCEYLKRCCETLKQENKRLQKELQQLRALKASKPFYMQAPATTLIMCPSCERVATTSGPATSTTAAPPTATAATNKPSTLFSI